MKRKHLFASAVMAAVLAGCSQDEVIVNDNLQSLGERPMVEAPVFTFNGVESRMTTTGGYAGVQWEAGDGFGYAVIDTYNPGQESNPRDFSKLFTIVDYINSNIMYHTEDGSSFYSHAESSVPEGNYLIYAPFNKDNISRGPLKVALPLTQVVTPAEGGAPSNSAITAFYKDDTTPVFVGYDKVFGEPKVEVSPELRHIFALPMVTLKLGEVNLLDEDGLAKKDDEGNKIYESKITIEAIEFTNKNQKLITEGYIKNQEIFNKLQLNLDKDGNPVYNEKKGRYEVVWDATEYEKNATADLLMKDGANVVKVNKDANYGSVRVNFEEGLTITTAKNGQFFMVLPAAEYAKEDLELKVYATINGESYVLTETSKNVETTAMPIYPAKAATLLPGLPYSADEYNADGEMKDTKGTSMIYTIEGGFSPASVVYDNYTQIADYDDLVNFVEKIAYRNTALKEISADDAINAIKAGTPYDRKQYFVITATEENPIVLDDNFIAKFKNACVVNNKTGAKITFLGGKIWEDTNKDVVLGDIEWNSTASTYVKFASGHVYAAGDVTLKDVPVTGYVLPLEGATVTLNSALTSPVKISNMYNGTINLNSSLAHTIDNDYGTLNVNVTTDAVINNGISPAMYDQPNRAEIHAALEKDSYDDYESSMVVADNVKLNGTVRNRETGYAELGEIEAVKIVNNGEIKTTASGATLTEISGTGSVNNTAAAKILKNTGNEVYAIVNRFNLSGSYDSLAGLNKLVVNSVITSAYYATWNPAGNDINTIDFISGGGINLSSEMSKKDIDLSDVETINIKANTTWVGRSATKTTVIVANGAIREAAGCTLTIKDIAVPGYNKVAGGTSTAGISTLIANASTEAVSITLTGDVKGDGIVMPKDAEDIVIDLNGKTLDITGATVGSGSTQTSGLQLLKGTNVIIRNGKIKATDNANAKILIQNYANLTLEDVTLEGNAKTKYVLSNNNGTVKIIGNTNITATEGNYAFDVYYWPKGGYSNVNVTVNTTGTITGNVEYASDGTAMTSSSNGTLAIQAGTFKGNFVTTLDKTYVTFAKNATYNGTGWSK